MYNSNIPNNNELPSTAKLIKSTVIALVVALVLLVTVVIPAEYGIDPTGASRVLGLVEMGEIKSALHAEAEADAIAHSVPEAKEHEVPPKTHTHGDGHYHTH
jgi:hypothetical protein